DEVGDRIALKVQAVERVEQAIAKLDTAGGRLWQLAEHRHDAAHEAIEPPVDVLDLLDPSDFFRLFPRFASSILLGSDARGGDVVAPGRQPDDERAWTLAVGGSGRSCGRREIGGGCFRG